MAFGLVSVSPVARLDLCATLLREAYQRLIKSMPPGPDSVGWCWKNLGPGSMGVRRVHDESVWLLEPVI